MEPSNSGGYNGEDRGQRLIAVVADGVRRWRRSRTDNKGGGSIGGWTVPKILETKFLW